MASEKKPFWKKALKWVAVGIGVAAVVAGCAVAVAASHGTVAAGLGVAWGYLATHAGVAAGVAAGAGALGLTGIAAYFASRSGKSKERKQARMLAKAEKLYAKAGHPCSPSHAQALQHQMAFQQQMGYALPLYSVAPPAYSVAPPLGHDAKVSLPGYLSSYPALTAHRHPQKAPHHKSELVSSHYNMGLGR